jgi:hypothetical protein
MTSRFNKLNNIFSFNLFKTSLSLVIKDRSREVKMDINKITITNFSFLSFMFISTLFPPSVPISSFILVLIYVITFSLPFIANFSPNFSCFLADTKSFENDRSEDEKCYVEECYYHKESSWHKKTFYVIKIKDKRCW